MNKPLRVLCVSVGDSAERAIEGLSADFQSSFASNRGEFELLLSSERWDVVLCDWQSPGYGRLEIIEVVGAKDARLAVVILTESGSEAIAAEAIKRGATDYLTGSAEQLLRLPDTLRTAVVRQRGVMSASELRALPDASGDGIVVVSNDGKLLHGNELARKLWNLSQETLRLTDFDALQAYVAEQMVDPAAFLESTRTSLHSDASGSFTMSFKDGRVVERRTEPQMLSGRRIGWVISYRDVTQKVQTEQHLRKLLALQEATLDATADGILVLDTQLRVAGTNRKFQQLWRLSDELIASDDGARLLEYALKQLKEPQAFMTLVEWLYERPTEISSDIVQFKDGRVFEGHSQPHIVEGVPVGRVWSFRDVTAIKSFEAALSSSEARFRLMFEQSADALLILDGASGRFIDCNRAALDIFHCVSKQAIISLRPSQLSPARQPDGRDSIDKASEMIAIAIRDGSHRFEWLYCSMQREDFSAEVLLTPVISGPKQLLIATVRDISDRKREERVQRALWEISEAAQSTETLNELFPRMHQIIGSLLPARNFFVALYSEKHGELSFPYYEDEFDANPGVIKMSDGTVTGLVIERGEAMLFTPDSTNDGMFEEVPFVGTDSMDWLGVPLKCKSRILGALVVQSYNGSVRYTEKDKSLLEFVCGQVAAAIERK